VGAYSRNSQITDMTLQSSADYGMEFGSLEMATTESTVRTPTNPNPTTEEPSPNDIRSLVLEEGEYIDTHICAMNAVRY